MLKEPRSAGQKHISRQIFTRFRLNRSTGRAFAPPSAQSITIESGATLSLFAAGIFVFVLFVASYSQRSTWLAFCSMSMSMALVLGWLFISTVHDHSQLRIRFAWAASELPQLVDWQIADDLASVLEHPAIFPRATSDSKGATQRRVRHCFPRKTWPSSLQQPRRNQLGA